MSKRAKKKTLTIKEYAKKISGLSSSYTFADDLASEEAYLLLEDGPLKKKISEYFDLFNQMELLEEDIRDELTENGYEAG